jgi:hypothetical protein
MEENNSQTPPSEMPQNPEPQARPDNPTEQLTHDPNMQTPSSQDGKPSSILKNKKMLIIAGIAVFVLIVILLFVRLLLPSKTTVSENPTPTPTNAPTPSETPAVSVSPTIVSSKQTINSTPTTKPIASPTPTNKPSATNTPAPTPTPASPPQMSISYPTEGQSITMDSSQTFCVVDVPVANTQGLARKQNTGSGWSDYADANSSLCYSPSNGANTLDLQYKNSAGLESSVYTVHFTFQRN